MNVGSEIDMMHLLCATDLLPKSEAAIDRAGLLAEEHRASLSLLHVVAPNESERVLEQTLQNAIARMKSRAQPPLWQRGPTPAVQVRTGNPARLILEAAQELKSNLLIVGPHRSRGLRDVLEGTIAEKALRAGRRPLLIVRDAPRTAYRNVLLALDLSRNSGAVVKAAESLVLSEEACARIVHAYERPYPDSVLAHGGIGAEWPTTYSKRSLKRSVSVAIRNLLKDQSRDFTRYDVVVEDGDAASVIDRTMQSYEPELLIVGTRARGRLHRALLGSVANQVLSRARCDVLIVPAGCTVSPARATSAVRSPLGGPALL
jgi:nucleotide-binding universal stress UspA family protein